MKRIVFAIMAWGLGSLAMAQSNNCSTATPINLVGGSACMTGTTVGATSDNVLYGGCNATGLNEVWYTYITDGANNDWTINSLGLTNAQIVIYTGTCGLGGTLELCDNVAGAATLTASWGIAPGTQVWIGVMSNLGAEGSFELCVDSYAPDPTGGNTCAGAIPICSIGSTTTIDMTPLNSSGVTPSCFVGTGNLDVWIEFEVTQAGTVEWSAIPSSGNVELDWAMYDMAGGCPGPPGGPGTLVACNYNYAGAIGAAIGMNDATSCVVCPTSAIGGACDEFCSEAFLAPGTYAIMIDFYIGTVGTIDFGFTGGTTALIAPVADFTASPTMFCGPDMTVNITDNTVGAGVEWDFGNGNTYSGNNPPGEYYNSPGTYAITASFPAASCPSTFTQFVQLVPPLAGTAAGSATCNNPCDGTASVTSATGGDGSYTYTWTDGALNPIGQTSATATGLCSGSYYVTIDNAVCGTIDVPVTITAPAQEVSGFSVTPNCDGGVTVVSDPTYTGTFTFDVPPADAAVCSPGGVVSNATPGWSYDIIYVTDGSSGLCSDSTVVTLTVPALDDPSYTLTPACDGGTATITGTGGGTFSFDTPPLDAAWIDPATGVISGGTSGTTYDVIYVTSGTCPDSLVLSVTASAGDDPTFGMTSTCDGGTAAVGGTPGGVFSFLNPPGDGAVIDPGTGAVTGGTPGATYDIQYTTLGVCADSSTQQVTALTQDDPSFTMTPTCDGASATITGLSGGTFTFTSPPSDGASIDPVTGLISGGTPGTSYYVSYTTNGPCPATSNGQVDAIAADDPTFSMTPTCSGAVVASVAMSGGSFAFNTAPTDGAVIDPATGAITGGTPGTAYDVMYTTSGTCPDSTAVQVSAYTLPNAPMAGTDATYCTSDFFDAMTASGAGGTFTWYADGGLTTVLGLGSTMMPGESVGTITYYVTETINGCEGPASMVLITMEECSITIPTAFTPDGDMTNDYWNIMNMDDVYPNNTVRVYNRWGNLLYESEQGNYDGRPWNGEYQGNLLPVGSYYYIIDFNDKDNEQATGTVSIILNK